MADVLKHLEERHGEYQTDSWWTPRSFLQEYSDAPLAVDYMERYRLKLVSQVGFAVHPGDYRALEAAKRHARQQLVHHLYSEQLDLTYEALHAVYGGESRDKVAGILTKLIESMTER
jgi:hypothetical protein